MLRMNSKNSMNHSNEKDTIKQLILNYIEAENNGDHALAERIRQDINEIQRLCDKEC